MLYRVNNRYLFVYSSYHTAVLIPMDQYNAMMETEYLMASKEMEKAILAGMEDVKNGNFVEVDIDEL